MRKAIAIDFDGCLCENKWPEIGEPHMDVINAAIEERENGNALILWTCRAGERLGEAVAWCAGFGLTFDAVNANLPERLAHFKTESRKVSADEYWDDAAVVMGREAEAPVQEETREIRERMLRDAVLRDAVKTWDAEAQTKMLLNKIGELVQDVYKASRTENWQQRMEGWHNIAGEIADVKIMLGMMEILFDVEDAVEVCKQNKIDRLQWRLEEAHAKEGAGE